MENQEKPLFFFLDIDRFFPDPDIVGQKSESVYSRFDVLLRIENLSSFCCLLPRNLPADKNIGLYGIFVFSLAVLICSLLSRAPIKAEDKLFTNLLRCFQCIV